MSYPLTVQHITIGNHELQLMVPDATVVKAQYYRDKAINTHIAFPFWTKLWPAAMAMAKFLTANTHLMKEKRVLELAGGLGLPSLIASAYAREVICSDYLTECTEVIHQSVVQNAIKNISVAVINWNHLAEIPDTDVLLLSDINYEPSSFEALQKMLQHFIDQHVLIVLSTPQRLMAKSFIEQWLSYAIEQHTEIVITEEGTVPVSIFVLCNQKA